MTLSTTTERVLFVDDDVHLLQALRRSLRKRLDLVTAEGGEEGLRCFDDEGPFSVVVADMRMPRMDGIAFLQAVRRRSPQTIRLMLTGNNDLETATKAVNHGEVFRFLNKPCHPDELVQAVTDGQRQFQLEQAERDLLERTLTGTVHLMTDILAMVDEEDRLSSADLQADLRWLCQAFAVDPAWPVEVAGQLHHIGVVGLPPGTVVRWRNGRILDHEEQNMIAEIPVIGSQFLANVPRLEPVAQIVLWQDKHFDGGGHPPGGYSGEDIPIGSRILKVLKDLAEAEQTGIHRCDALVSMLHRDGVYDMRLVEALAGRYPVSAPTVESATIEEPARVERCARDMKVDSVVLADVKTVDGAVLVSAGNRITGPMLQRLVNFGRLGKLAEPIPVNEHAQPRRAR